MARRKRGHRLNGTPGHHVRKYEDEAAEAYAKLREVPKLVDAGRCEVALTRLMEGVDHAAKSELHAEEGETVKGLVPYDAFRTSRDSFVKGCLVKTGKEAALRRKEADDLLKRLGLERA